MIQSVNAAGRNWESRLVLKKTFGLNTYVEMTPFVWKDKLYQVQNWPADKKVAGDKSEIQIVDLSTAEILSCPFLGHYFGAGFVCDDRLYVYAGDMGETGTWTIERVYVRSTDDLVSWTEPELVLEAEKGEHIFNVGVCRGKDGFVMLYETNDADWPAFTFKYCRSENLKDWERIPGGLYGTDKYVGGPALYFEGDYYYTLALVVVKPHHYQTIITRSRDCVVWEDAPTDRPFVTYDTNHITDPDNHPGMNETNASDPEVCYWQGRTMVYYLGGSQDELFPGIDIHYAEFDGTMRELFEHYFE